MKAWGPADWAAVVAGAVAVLSVAVRVLWALSEIQWRDIWPERRPEGDPRNKLPYRRPVDGA